MNGIPDLTPSGLYCNNGDFYIDPRRPVKRAVITHAHADHARGGSQSYLCAQNSKALLQARLGRETKIETLDYGEALTVNSVKISLHPAGHILGSAQVKIDQGRHVCVVSGDYKTDRDPTCLPLEPLRCQTFISECTFGLPIFRWPPPEQVENEIKGLVDTIAVSGAERIMLTHGYATEMARWLQQKGCDAEAIPTAYGDEVEIDGKEA